LCPCKVRNKFLVTFWNRTIILCILCINVGWSRVSTRWDRCWIQCVLSEIRRDVRCTGRAHLYADCLFLVARCNGYSNPSTKPHDVTHHKTVILQLPPTYQFSLGNYSNSLSALMKGATISPETMKLDSRIKRQHVPQDINLYVTVQVITAVAMKVTVCWVTTRVGCLRLTDVSAESDASIFTFHEFKKRSSRALRNVMATCQSTWRNIPEDFNPRLSRIFAPTTACIKCILTQGLTSRLSVWRHLFAGNSSLRTFCPLFLFGFHTPGQYYSLH